MKVNSKVWARNYFNWLYKHRTLINSLVVLATAGMIYLASHLKIRSSLSDLLPQNLPSVIQLNAVMDRLGGTGFLLVGVDSPDFEANKKFVEALAAKLSTLPANEIRYIEYRYKETRDFIEKFGLHYLNETQLKQLKTRLEDEISSKKDSAVSSFLGLDDDEEKKVPKTNIKDALSKELDPRIQRFTQYPEAYIGSDDGKLLVIRILPKTSSLSVDSASKLTRTVQKMIDELNPKSFNPEMKTGFAGTIQRTLEEHDSIKHDIVDTSIELVILILAVLLIFFWSLRWIILLVMNLCIGVAWTFGFTQVAIGYLNTQTAFLGSLVVGTGINYGVILLARYLEERRKGTELQEAIVVAVRSTSIATLLASSTTAVSFASLLVADNKGLSQFGFIGCVGIYFCWIAAYLLLPLWIFQWETHWPRKNYNHPLAAWGRGIMSSAGTFMIKITPILSVILVMVSVLGIYGFRQLAKDPLEYNFAKLQNRVSLEKGSTVLNARIQSQVFKGNLSLSFILLESPDEAQELCPAIRKLVASIPASQRVYESCATLFELIPPFKDTAAVAKERRLRMEIKSLMSNRLLKFSDSNTSSMIARVRDKMSLEPPRIQDIPHQLSRRFEEKDGTLGLIGFITPASDRPLEDARNLFNYTNAFSKITLPQSGSVVSASGDAWIISDLLQTIQTDGPRIAMLAFSMVVFLTFLLSGSLRGGLLMAACLIIATWWQLCFQGMMGIKFNFFNFIAIPITFGIGVDYPINVFLRAREEAFKNYGAVLATTGSAVILCSLTTTIGYYTLLGASNQALTSFAHLAIIGEVACLAAAIIFLPVALRLLGKFRQDLIS